jgi:hypothetical protein
MAALNPKALEALTLHQRQLDMDGVEVGVSRQALDELISAYLSSTSAGVTEEQVEAACAKYAWARYGGTVVWPRDFSPKPKEISEGRENMRAALEASRVAPVSQKEADGVPSALDRIIADDCLKRARSKLSFDEIKKMIDHTKAAIREGGSNA